MIVLKCRRKGGDLLAFGPDSRMLAARSETGLQLWNDIASGNKAKVFRDLTSVASIQFTPDGKLLVFDGAESGAIDLATGEVNFLAVPEGGSRYSSLTADGRHLLVVRLPQDPSHNRIECWPYGSESIARKSPLWSVRMMRAFAGRPIPLTEGQFMLVEGEYRSIQHESWRNYVIRSRIDGKRLGETKRMQWFSERHAVSSDGKWLVGQHTNELRIWSLENLAALPLERKNDSRKIFTDVAFHPSGRWLGVTSTDETVKLFETSSWEVTRTYSWGIGKLVGIAFSPDGSLAAAGSDKGRIVIWDVED